MLFFNWLAPQNQPAWVANARSKPILDDLGQRLVAALPSNPEKLILNRIHGLADQPAEGDASGADTGNGDAGNGSGDARSDQPTSIEGVIGNAKGDQPATGN